MGERLTLEVLLRMSPLDGEGNDKVTAACRRLLLELVKLEPRVHEVFFPEAVPTPMVHQADTRSFPLSRLATAYMAEAVSEVKDEFLFHSTLDRSAVQECLRELYDGLPWKKMGFSLYTLLYPDVVQDKQTGVYFREFLGDDGHLWAERVLGCLSGARWARSTLQRVVCGGYGEADYNRDMNDLFVKLHLLDPQSVIPAFQTLLAQKALPAVNLELATRNYLGRPLDWRQVRDAVCRAEHAESTAARSKRASLSQLHVTFGALLDEFIVTECRNLGLWNGRRPANCRLLSAADRCLLM